MRALWSERPNCSQNVSQKVERIRRFSDMTIPAEPRGEKKLILGTFKRRERGSNFFGSFFGSFSRSSNQFLASI